MSFVGHGWRSGQATDPAITAGAASTATVSSLAPNTSSRNAAPFQLVVTGTGFSAQSVVYANYNPIATTFVNATTLNCPGFRPMPDSGAAGTIPIGVKKQPSEKLSNTVNFTAT